MKNVGDTVIFTSDGTLPGSPCPAYVWKFWDASVQVSAVNRGTVTKCLNAGGNPAETGLAVPFSLPYHVDICDYEGNVIRGRNLKLPVNNPPSLYGNPTATPNSQAFPFATQVRVQAYDMENNGVHFYWYSGITPVGGQDVTTGPVAVPGTYHGTLIGANRNSYTNVLSTTVTGPGTVLTCKLVDNDNGTNLVRVPVLGYNPNAPQFSANTASGIVMDAYAPEEAVIAPGQTVAFTAIASSLDNPGTMVGFTWTLYGTNGWTQSGLPIRNSGVTWSVPPQDFQNVFNAAIEHEVGDGVRSAELTVWDFYSGAVARTKVDVYLKGDSAPVMRSVGAFSADGLTPFTGPISKVTNPMVRLSALSTDAEQDVVYYKWVLTLPAAPFTMECWGHDCFIDVSSFPSGTSGNLGIVTAYDKYGAASLPFSIGQVTIA